MKLANIDAERRLVARGYQKCSGTFHVHMAASCRCDCDEEAWFRRNKILSISLHLWNCPCVHFLPIICSTSKSTQFRPPLDLRALPTPYHNLPRYPIDGDSFLPTSLDVCGILLQPQGRTQLCCQCGQVATDFADAGDVFGTAGLCILIYW